ncbi:hypothetical protein HB766_04110 [Listeria welshimeri]|nr:hypothetical protein [Listeria welshimeri]
MKKENEFLSSISLEDAKKTLKLKDIYEVMKGDKDQNFSIELKKIIILLLVVVVRLSIKPVFHYNKSNCKIMFF